MRTLAYGIVLLLFMVPGALAGSADDPEVGDSGSDSSSRPDMDLEAAWFEVAEPQADDPVVRFTFKLAGDPPHLPAFFAAHEEFRLNFVTEEMASGVAEMYVSLRPTCSQTSAVVTSAPTCESDQASCRVGFAAAAGGYQALEAETAVEGFMDGGDRMGCAATYSQLGMEAGATILDPYVTHRLVVRGPLSGGDTIGPEVVEEFDRAPDTGFGRSFVLPPAEQEAPVVAYIELDDLPLRNETTEPTTATVQYNWTGDGPLRIQAQVDGGNLSINVTAAEGPLFSWSNGTSLNDTIPACGLANCSYALRFHLEDFVGSFSVEAVADGVGEEGAVADEGDGAPDDTPAGNKTLGATDEKDAPGPALPLVVVAVALAVWRRR